MIELEYFVNGPEGRHTHRVRSEAPDAIRAALAASEINGSPVECVHAHLVDAAGSVLLRPIPPEWHRDGVPSWWRMRVPEEAQALFAPPEGEREI